MKYLIIAILATSCALPTPRFTRQSIKPQQVKVIVSQKNSIDRLHDCVFRLIEQNGVNASTATKTCTSIFIRD
jgi:hypothetical protein